MRVRTLVVVGAVAVAALAVGCGKGDPSIAVDAGPATPAFLSQAAQKTRAARTGHIEGNLTMAADLALPTGTEKMDMAMTMTGEYDLEQPASHLVATLTRYDETGNGFAGSTTSSTKAGDISEEIQIGDSTYIKDTQSGKVRQHDGKDWLRRVKSSGSGSSDFLGVAFLGLGGGTNGQSLDAGALLEQLSKVSSSVTEQGRARVRDTDTRHVRASVALSKVMEEEAKTSPRSTPESACSKTAYDGTDITMDVFVDDDGYVRRISSTADLSNAMTAMMTCFSSEGFSGSSVPVSLPRSRYDMSSSVDFYSFGSPVTITAPDPAQVAEQK